MDIAYIHKNTGVGHEMRHSLRSLRNFPHSRVFVAGEKQPWMTNIEFLHNPQNSHVTKNALGSFLKILDSDISDDFVFMHDDHYIMKPIDKIPLYNRGTLAEVLVEIMRMDGNTSYWKVCKENLDYLQEVGIENPMSYHLHMPMVFNKRKMKESIEKTFQDKPNWWNQQYAVIYYNRFEIADRGQISDPKVRALQTPDEHATFLSSGNASFKQLRSLMRKRFPDPSEYENDIYRL